MKNFSTKKTAIAAVTAITLVLSFSAVSCGDSGGGGPIPTTPRPGPNRDKTVTDPLVQIKSLKVVYTGTTKNLVEFTNPEQAFYEVEETDATKATIEVEAEASNTNAKITAKWYTGSQDDDKNNIAGGESEDPITDKVRLLDVPVPDMPSDDDAAVIVSKVLITVTFNGDDGEGNTVSKSAVFDLYIYPPKVNTTLSDLVITTSGSGTLHPTFNSKITTYTMSKDGIPGAGTPWSGEDVTITAIPGDPAAKIKMTLSPTDRTVPAQSTAANGDPPTMTVKVAGAGLVTKTVKIAVTNGKVEADEENNIEASDGVTATYTITILPEQDTAGTVSSLQYVQFYYHDTTGKKKKDVAATNAFSPGQTRYTTWKPPAGYNSVYLKTATPTSYYAQAPVVTVSSYPSGVNYQFQNNAESSATVNPPVPIPTNEGELVTFTVTGRATGLTGQTAATDGTPPVGNNSSTPYVFSFANAKNTDKFTGTASFTGGAYVSGTEGSYPITRIDHVELEYETGAGDTAAKRYTTSGTIVTDGTDAAAGKWTVEIDKLMLDENRLKAFVVVMQKEVSLDNFVTYRGESIPITTTYTHQQNPIDVGILSVNASNIARLIYNAADFQALSTSTNENFYMNNDIDLLEIGREWVGPEGYSATFDGNGNTVKNYTFDSEIGELGAYNSQQSGYKLGLFNSIVAGATVKNRICERNPVFQG
ncbi:hypothetical protein FACS1894102_2760 [Spirochaetia bacterium]|nr:hypothetical protein FACS1894102_2760 [Spirochaetia bacterium]